MTVDIRLRLLAKAFKGRTAVSSSVAPLGARKPSGPPAPGRTLRSGPALPCAVPGCVRLGRASDKHDGAHVCDKHNRRIPGSLEAGARRVGTQNQTIDNADGTVDIVVSGGDRFTIDACDLEFANDYHWTRCEPTPGKVYAFGTIIRGRSLYPTLKRRDYLHRLVCRDHDNLTTKGWECDHIDGNTFDNRGSNLRVVTIAQNRANNRRAPKENGLPANIAMRPSGTYRVRVNVGKALHLRCGIQTLEEAVAIRDAIRLQFGMPIYDGV